MYRLCTFDYYSQCPTFSTSSQRKTWDCKIGVLFFTPQSNVYKAVCVWVGVGGPRASEPSLYCMLCLQKCIAAFFSSFLKNVLLKIIFFQTYVWTEADVFILLDWCTTDFRKEKIKVCDLQKKEGTDRVSVWYSLCGFNLKLSYLLRWNREQLSMVLYRVTELLIYCM